MPLGSGHIFGFTLPNFQRGDGGLVARDICVILDYSGSMRFASLLGTPYSGNRNCNNQDTVVPTFGAYSSGSGNTGMPAAAASASLRNANISITSSDGRLPIVSDFYTNSSGTPAFSAASSSYATTPGGDVPAKSNSGSSASYAQTVGQVLNIASPGNSTYNSTFETSGYAGLHMTSGTLGFHTQDRATGARRSIIGRPIRPMIGRTRGISTRRPKRIIPKWDSSGNLLPPQQQRVSNTYAAILNFIKNLGPSVFPSQLQSGRILYYS